RWRCSRSRHRWLRCWLGCWLGCSSVLLGCGRGSGTTRAGQAAGVTAERVERAGPEGADLRLQPRDPRALDAVQALPSLLLGAHQPDLRQEAEVLADRRPGDLEAGRDVTGVHRTGRQQLQDAAPGRL